jgi:DNA-directed RNA polymerase subunit RPC12/RpoP
MNAIAKCKKCGRDFNIQGNAFAPEDYLKTKHSTGANTEERCSHCGYIATYRVNELSRDNK